MIYTCIFKFPITWVYMGREDAFLGDTLKIKSEWFRTHIGSTGIVSNVPY